MKRRFVSFLVIMSSGVCGVASAQGQASVRMASFPLPESGPAAGTPALIAGMTALGPIAPPDLGGYSYWPCFTGGSDSDCSNIPSGGLVIGEPYSNWSYAACNVGVCAELIWTYASETASGSGNLSITIKQGNNLVFSNGVIQTGTLSPGGLYYGYWFLGTGQQNCAPNTTCVNARAGPAVVEVTLTLGTAKCVNREVIVFQ